MFHKSQSLAQPLHVLIRENEEIALSSGKIAFLQDSKQVGLSEAK